VRRVGPSLMLVLVLGGVGLAPGAALAHKPSDSYLALTLVKGAVAGRGNWDVAVRDLDYVLAIDADGDGAITWGELRARRDDIAAYALGRLSLSVGGEACTLKVRAMEIVRHSDGAYVRLPLALDCAGRARAAATAELDYRLFFDVDPQHRGLLRLDQSESASSDVRPWILSASDHRVSIPLERGTSHARAGLRAFVVAGARHIAGGIDHLLFLLALLLPAVLRRRADRLATVPESATGGAWAPVAALRPALADVARIVTAFTVAHSLTLSVAALGLARMPARLTEPAIAASVVIAAANNVWPLFGRDRWAVAFALGLLHGFGFSSALADGGFSGAGFVTALVGFNFGVELGQLALVAAFVPLAFALRRTLMYRRFILSGGSLAIAALALIWFVERALDVRFLTGSS
jgi:hypothetical protein